MSFKLSNNNWGQAIKNKIDTGNLPDIPEKVRNFFVESADVNLALIDG